MSARTSTHGYESATPWTSPPPRGDFVLSEEDTTPVFLLSAGVGVTPVLAMLHELAATHSGRDIWWLHTARSAAEHAFAAEAHHLLAGLDRSHEHVYYTAKSPATRINRETLAALSLPTTATAYLCGPSTFMAAMRNALTDLGLNADRIHTELFGALPAINPGLTDTVHTRRTSPQAPPAPGHGSPSPAADSPCRGATITPPSSTSPRSATYRPAGPAAPASATPARRRSSPAPSDTDPIPWSPRHQARRWSAARNPRQTSSWICKGSVHEMPALLDPPTSGHDRPP